MHTARLIFSIIFSAIVLTGSAAAQDAAAAQQKGSPSQGVVVTASSTSSGVRFVSPGEARRVRLEVYTQAGERLFDSDFRAGNIIDWEAQGIADGSYLCVVTVEDLQGASARRLSAVNVSQGRASVLGDSEEKLKADFPQALAAAGSSDSDASAARQKKSQALTLTAHDGQNGQVTSTTGSLTFRTGDTLSGNDREQMRVTPEGRVGIGTNDPQATLDVAGTIRARGGIQFEDGTVLKSAADAGRVGLAGVAAAGVTPAAAMSGSGTTGNIVKWVDGASGAVGDSVLTESNGNVGLGTASPQAKLDIAGATGMIFRTDTNSPGFSVFDRATSPGNQLVFQGNGGNFSVFNVTTKNSNIGASERPAAIAMWTVDVANTANATQFQMQHSPAQGGVIFTQKFGTGAQGDRKISFQTGWNQTSTPTQLVLDTTGRVGVGTAAPSDRLEVAGNLRVSGAGNGVIFPDGSKMTTAAGGAGSTPSGTSIVSAINDPATSGVINDNRLSANAARLNGANTWSAANTFGAGLKIAGAGNGIMFADGTTQTTAASGGSMTGTAILSAINDVATAGVISEARLSPNVAKLNAQNAWTGQNTFVNGLSSNGVAITNVGTPVSATDATNKAYTDSNFVKFVPGAEQLSVGDANGTAPMINLRGGSTCCSGPGGHTPAWFKVFQNGSFVATGNLGIGVSPMQGKGYRTSWDSYKGAFRSGYADAEWDDANVGFFSWAGGSNSTAIGLYALAFGDTNSAESTSSIVFGSGNQVKGAAGFSAGAGNRVCDTYGVAFGNKAQSGGPLINGKCDPDSFNLRGLAAVAIGYNVTADQDHTTAMGKFASNNGFTGTFVWSDGSATASADTFRNTANNEFAARATGGFRFRTNLAGTTGCNLPAGSGVFNCTSSRTTKENFSVVSGDDILASLRKVPVSTWNYIAEGQQSRHLGPMAEDFYGAFKLGTTDKAIGIQDAVGVSLAAVKALDARTLELQQKTEEVEQLRTKVNSLEQRLAALEQLMQQQSAKQSEDEQK